MPCHLNGNASFVLGIKDCDCVWTFRYISCMAEHVSCYFWPVSNFASQGSFDHVPKRALLKNVACIFLTCEKYYPRGLLTITVYFSAYKGLLRIYGGFVQQSSFFYFDSRYKHIYAYCCNTWIWLERFGCWHLISGIYYKLTNPLTSSHHSHISISFILHYLIICLL